MDRAERELQARGRALVSAMRAVVVDCLAGREPDRLRPELALAALLDVAETIAAEREEMHHAP